MWRKNAWKKLSLIIALIIISTCSAIPPKYPVVGKAYADGMSFESLPSFLVQGRPVSLFIKIDPQILTAQNASNPSLQLRLFDPTNNETILHVSYIVYATKGDQEMMNLRFHSHAGPLKLNIHPKAGPVAVLDGEQDTNSGIWTAKDGEIDIQTPMMLEGGLYHFQITVLGMNQDTNIFDPNTAPIFDSWLSIGEAFHGNLSYANQNHDFVIISYYDRIKEYSFDPLANTIYWSMPFDWNLERIQKQNIFVHEEVRVPKSFIKFLNSTSFFPAVDGIPLNTYSVAVDPYSSEDSYIVHYLINKDLLIQLAQKHDQQKTSSDESNLMSFSLFVSSRNNQPSTEFFIPSGIRINVSWKPNQLTSNNGSALIVQFSDVLEGVGKNSFQNANIFYNLRIVDKNGVEIIKKVNLTAINGTDSQLVTFSANDTYKISISVTGIERQGLLDQSRDGEATGIVVVPEFTSFLTGNANLILIVGIIISVMLLTTRAKQSIS